MQQIGNHWSRCYESCPLKALRFNELPSASRCRVYCQTW